MSKPYPTPSPVKPAHKGAARNRSLGARYEQLQTITNGLTTTSFKSVAGAATTPPETQPHGASMEGGLFRPGTATSGSRSNQLQNVTTTDNERGSSSISNRRLLLDVLPPIPRRDRPGRGRMRSLL